VIGQRGARVVELVGGGDALDRRRRLAQVRHVRLLVGAPAVPGVARGAGGDDRGHRAAELALDARERARAALILDRVVEQRRARLVLAASVLEHQAAHAEQVRQVGHPGAFAFLCAVKVVRERERAREAIGEDHRRR
jgi:hypothetical protein